MNLSSLNIERPVLSSVLSIVIVIFGFIGFIWNIVKVNASHKSKTRLHWFFLCQGTIR